MAFLGFTGGETRLLTRLLKVRSKTLGVPWVAVLISAIPSVCAFLTGSNERDTAPQTVPLS